MMKNVSFILGLLLVFASCNTAEPTQVVNNFVQNNVNDSGIIEIKDSVVLNMDSLMKIRVKVSKLIDSSRVNVDCLKEFNKLANRSNGELKVLVNSKLLSDEIVKSIKKHAQNNTDLMILIDKTGSMTEDLVNVKTGLNRILETIREYEGIRLAVGTYGDKNVDGPNWYDFKNFESNFDDVQTFVDALTVTGGGDFPESVNDGIYRAFQEGFWSSNNKRMVLLIGDAPSLEDSLSDHSLSEIVEIAKKDEVHMNFYPIVLSPTADTSSTIASMEKRNFLDIIFPNPCTGSLTLQLKNKRGLSLEFFDQKGAVVKRLQTKEASETIDLSDLSDGVYVVRAFDKHKNYDTEKFVLSKGM